jgi:hypothetical protein
VCENVVAAPLCAVAEPDGTACQVEGETCRWTPDMPCHCWQGHWSCEPSPWVAGCPSVIPLNGRPCETEGMICGYGYCGSLSAAQRTCEQGFWVDQWDYCLP